MDAWSITCKSLRAICKKWKGIGEKYFFQSMRCTSPENKDWESLADRLGRRPDGSFGVGKFVLRLVLKATNDSSTKLKHMLHIVQGCLNVVSLFVSAKDVFDNLRLHGADIASACLLTPARHLQRLDLDFSPWFDESIVISLLRHCPNLEILNVGSSFGHSEEGFIIESTDMSKLHTLTLTSCSKNWLTHFDSNAWGLTNLRHLSLFRIGGVDNVIGFFDVVGSQLKSFHFDTPSVEIDYIIQKCTGLEEIIISLRSYLMSAVNYAPFGHNNVTRIGIRDSDGTSAALLSLEEVESSLEEMASWFTTQWSFPKLISVRLMDVNARKFAVMLKDGDRRDIWKEFIFALAEAGVTLEDEDGVKLPGDSRLIDI